MIHVSSTWSQVWSTCGPRASCHETGEGAREGLALGWVAPFVEGSARHDNHPAISVGDFMGFSQKHPAIKGYPHLWKSPYVYIYIIESQYGLGRLSRQNWIMESLCFFSGMLKKSVPVFFHSEHSQLRSRAHTSEVAACSHCNFASNCWCLVQRPCTEKESWQKAKWNSTSQNHKPASR